MRWTPTRGPRDPWTPRGGWSVVEYLRPSTPAHRRRAGALCASPYSLPSLLFSKQKRPPEQHFALRVAFLSFDVADVFCRRKEYGNVRCALTAGVKAMEMHAMRRPVYGGPARIGRKKMAAQRYRAGGPGVLWTPGRRPPHRNGGNFGSFGHERTTIIREVVKKMAAKPNPITKQQGHAR